MIKIERTLNRIRIISLNCEVTFGKLLPQQVGRGIDDAALLVKQYGIPEEQAHADVLQWAEKLKQCQQP